jgi:hypothetical protein
MIDNEMESRRGTPSVYPTLPPSPFQYLIESGNDLDRKEGSVVETSCFTSPYRSPSKSSNSVKPSNENRSSSPLYKSTKTSNNQQQIKFGTPLCNSSRTRSHEDNTLNGKIRFLVNFRLNIQKTFFR